MSPRAPRNIILPGDGDERHGTQNGYVNLLCRCRDCKDAVRDYNRERQERWRRRNGVQPRVIRGRTHGTISCYNAGCTEGPGGKSCDECRRAAREYRARYRKANA